RDSFDGLTDGPAVSVIMRFEGLMGRLQNSGLPPLSHLPAACNLSSTARRRRPPSHTVYRITTETVVPHCVLFFSLTHDFLECGGAQEVVGEFDERGAGDVVVDGGAAGRVALAAEFFFLAGGAGG